MVQERMDSGMSGRGVWSVESYYYRLRQLRLGTCQALQEVQSVQLAEVPLAPKEPQHPVSLRLTTGVGTLEILDAGPATLDIGVSGQ